jgi:MYXO-CTERM domain-containing protein
MCQVACQTDIYTQCETEMVEKCETDCMTTGGAIFCEGQFLSAGDINSCADELASEIDIHVDVELDVDAAVSVNTGGGDDDDGDGKGGGDSVISCSVADAGAGTGSLGGALSMLGLAGVLYRRRARNRRAS